MQIRGHAKVASIEHFWNHSLSPGANQAVPHDSSTTVFAASSKSTQLPFPCAYLNHIAIKFSETADAGEGSKTPLADELKDEGVCECRQRCEKGEEEERVHELTHHPIIESWLTE